MSYYHNSPEGKLVLPFFPVNITTCIDSVYAVQHMCLNFFTVNCIFYECFIKMTDAHLPIFLGHKSQKQPEQFI